MKKIVNYLLQGILYIAPISATGYIIYVIFTLIDGLLGQTIETFLDVNIPGLGLIVIIIFLILVGIVGQTIIARPFKKLFNGVIEKTPFLKVIYTALNDLFSAFVGKEKKFNKPVMVLINVNSNLEKLGFLTSEDLSKLGEKDKVSVYFPHSYAFSGELYIVPKEHVRPLDINPATAMKFIVSGGVSGIDEKEQ